MPVQILWDDPQNDPIVIMQFDPDWSLNDYLTAHHDLLIMMRGIFHPVHLIMLNPGGNPPPGFVSELGFGLNVYPDTSLIVIVESSHYLRMLINSTRRIYRAKLRDRLHIVGTLEQAHRVIAEYNAAS